MADDTAPQPIVVTASATPGQLAQAIRTLLSALGGYMIGQHWVDSDVASAAITVIMLGAPLAWGQWKAFQTHADRVTMANELPDEKAVVK